MLVVYLFLIHLAKSGDCTPALRHLSELEGFRLLF